MESSNADEILAAYLAESSEHEAAKHLHTLIAEIAAPYVRMVVAANLRGPQQAETNDAAQEVLLELTAHLRRLHEAQLGHVREAQLGHVPDAQSGHVPDAQLGRPRDAQSAAADRSPEPPIRNFRAYVASAARRAAGFVLRRSNPERYRLRNRARYSLKTGSRFTLTEDEQGRRIAGLARFPHSVTAGAPATSDQLKEIPVPPGAAGMDLPALIERILEPLGRPAFLDDLADYIGAALGGFARQEDFEAAAHVASSNLSDQMQQRAWLAHLWTEIVELPRNQRAALLLNLRDHLGDSALRLFPSMGIATIRQIAVALEMPPEALAALWRQLPIEDRQIAEMLSLTRQQIANLRKSARDRLMRRMGTAR